MLTHNRPTISAPGGTEPSELQPPPRIDRRRSVRKWTRWLHVYASMVALLVVLFFGITGITLNHPEWTFGFDPTTEISQGTLPAGSIDDEGSIEFLTISEFLRAEYNVKGEVAGFGADATEGFVSYRGPGYGADAIFDLDTGAYEMTIQQQSWVGVFNDLHKGRDTDASWNWLIDVSGAFLVAISLTGLALQLFLKQRRRAAILTAIGGTLVTVAFIALAIR